ncbi:MAG: chemotaxis-specific protein-glutamate methyltransferase CheB [Saccharofermentanaceae bacterium]|jgi:two-component system chemotaxis response regulator CheB|nr:chemotaxis-specific protein-glutamate methyltransferase CheB [Bacteroidales bacterium]
MKAIRKIRVLIVEDSKVNQELLKGLLEEDPVFEVIGVVSNGADAVKFVTGNLPDVVSMDIYMPVMDGMEATRKIMQFTPVPIVIVSSFYNTSEVKMSFSILEAGALTILPRPYGPGHLQYQQTARIYRNTLKMMAEVKVKTIYRSFPPIAKINQQISVFHSTVLSSRSRSATPSDYKIIAIGASAGGPQVIQFILKELPPSLPVPVLIVQHIDANFAKGFVDWISSFSSLPVHVACHGEMMIPGHVYFPPGDHHLGALSPGVIAVRKKPPEKGLRPAVSFLFREVLAVYGKSAIGILLSGMGSDGAEELKMLYDQGAYTIAQDASSSLVHGMPGEAIRIGGAFRVLSPGEIVAEIIELFHK